jgi:hypothetical protein
VLKADYRKAGDHKYGPDHCSKCEERKETKKN